MNVNEIRLAGLSVAGRILLVIMALTAMKGLLEGRDVVVYKSDAGVTVAHGDIIYTKAGVITLVTGQ